MKVFPLGPLESFQGLRATQYHEAKKLAVSPVTIMVVAGRPSYGQGSKKVITYNVDSGLWHEVAHQ